MIHFLLGLLIVAILLSFTAGRWLVGLCVLGAVVFGLMVFNNGGRPSYVATPVAATEDYRKVIDALPCLPLSEREEADYQAAVTREHKTPHDYDAIARKYCGVPVDAPTGAQKDDLHSDGLKCKDGSTPGAHCAAPTAAQETKAAETAFLWCVHTKDRTALTPATVNFDIIIPCAKEAGFNTVNFNFYTPLPQGN